MGPNWNPLAPTPVTTLLLLFIVAAPSGLAQRQLGPLALSRPSQVFEPTISFVRQNLKIVTGYVALLRSIFYEPYERPLITSTDEPRLARILLAPARSRAIVQ